MGNLAQLFETGEQTSQKGHFRNLVLIARHDGNILTSESNLLMSLANKLSLTKEQIKEIIDHPEEYPAIPPYSAEERHERFVQLIQMGLIDGIMTAEEEKFIRKLAISIGLTEDWIQSHLKMIIEKLQKGIKRDEILASL